MKLKKLALLSETIGGAAIVVTLVILIVEIRGNTAVLEASYRQSISARVEERTMAIAGNPQLSEIMSLAFSDPDAIETGSAEWSQLSTLYVSLMTATEEAYLLYQDGHLDEEYFYARARRALTVLDNSIGREFFRDSRAAGTYLPEFMDWIDDTFKFGEEGREFRNVRGVPQQLPGELE